MQEADAERRLQILRRLEVEAPPASSTEQEGKGSGHSGQDGSGRERKRRRIAGEDDTDRDIRFAQENNAIVPAKAEMQMKSKKSSDAPITDGKGHINLFPVEGSRGNAPKNAEVEAEKAKKEKEFEDQYTMRFSNAAGFKQSIGQKPWYQTLGTNGADAAEVEAPSKDVWGNEDPRRREREKLRMTADDPLAAIHRGVAGVREVERERKRWKEDKDREIRDIDEVERRWQRKKRRHRHEDDLEGFSLDANVKGEDNGRQYRDEGSKSSHRHRSRSRDRSHHRRHHHKHRNSKDVVRPGWEVGPGGRYSSQFAQTGVRS